MTTLTETTVGFIGLGLKLPATELNRDLYQKLIEQGGGGLDHSALIQMLERGS